MKKTGKRILYGAIAIVVIGIAAYPKLPTLNKEDQAKGAVVKPSPTILTVDGVIVNPESLRNQVNVTGTLLANESVELNSEVSGKVVAITFKEGDRVRKGDLMVKLDDDEIKAELEKLLYTKKLNEDNEFRERTLFEKEAISREEYETSLNELNTINSEIKVLKARLAKHSIRAPFDGYVGLRDVSLGSYLTPGMRITEISNIDPVKLEFSIPSKYLSLVNPGDPISFIVDAYPQSFFGQIYAIEPQIDPQTRNIRLRARASNANTKLLPGQFARISLTLETIDRALMVPTQSIIPELNSKKLYLYKGGKVSTRTIQSGIRKDETLQITEGIDAGDTVITSGVLQIREGMQVKVRL